MTKQKKFYTQIALIEFIPNNFYKKIQKGLISFYKVYI